MLSVDDIDGTTPEGAALRLETCADPCSVKVIQQHKHSVGILFPWAQLKQSKVVATLT